MCLMTTAETRDAGGSVKPRWLWRTLGFSIPLHAAVFALAYFGGMHLVESEMIRGLGRESQRSLSTAVESLHLTMRDESREELLRRLSEFLAAHQDQHLHLWSAGGEHLAGDLADHPLAEQDAVDVAEFTRQDRGEFFWLARAPAGGPYLRGMVRLDTDARCLPCHEPGQTRGVLSMTRSLSSEIGEARRRLSWWVGLGIVSWVVLMVVVTRLTAQTFERSAARVRADLDAGVDGAAARTPSMAAQILDPTSLALFESLRRHLKAQQRREEDVASRLQHADRLASLGRLAAGLAHEIKNPLAGVQGALEILRDEAPGDPNREVYEQMLDELKRVDGTIRALLRYARPSPPRRSSTDVASLLEETVQLLRPDLARRGIGLDLETPPDLPRFPLDAEQIRQVLVNLITNAAEAIEQSPGGPHGRIVVRAAVFPEDGDLVLAVEDDGPGIGEDDRRKIFQPFFTSKFAGTGLGLAVVDSLVARHGGRVELESEPGKGSTFFVILPAAGESSAAPPETAARRASEEGGAWP